MQRNSGAKRRKTNKKNPTKHQTTTTKKHLKQKEMREKRNLRFLADKGSVSLQLGGNLDVANENQMKGREEVSSPYVTVTHKLERTAICSKPLVCRRRGQPDGSAQAGSACCPSSLPASPFLGIPHSLSQIRPGVPLTHHNRAEIE